MKWVRQKHKLGCASASLAMIAGIDYDSALSLVHPARKKGTRVCTTIGHMSDVMRGMGMPVTIRYNPADLEHLGNPVPPYPLSEMTCSHNRWMWLGDWLGRPIEPALLTVWMEPYIPWRHAVVWDGSTILDPMIEPSKRDIPDSVYFKNLVSAIIVR